MQNRHLVIVAFVALIGAGLFLLWQENEQQKEQAIIKGVRAEAVSAVKDLLAGLSDSRITLDHGKITDADQKLLERISKKMEIFRFLFVNARGTTVLASRPGALGKRGIGEGAWAVIKTGKDVMELSRDRFKELRKYDSGKLKPVMILHVPAMDGDRFLGAVVVYMDYDHVLKTHIATTSLRAEVRRARQDAISLGATLMQRVTNPTAMLAYGNITESDAALIRRLMKEENVFRYVITNSRGVVVLASRPPHLGKTIAWPEFRAVKKGRVQTPIARKRYPELNRPGIPTVVIVHVPVMIQGKFRGAILSFMDISNGHGPK